MARIAFIQNKLGKTDGVSLEVDKWRRVLETLGHEVCYIAGNDDVAGVHVVPELSLFHPMVRRILNNGTVEFTDYDSEAELIEDIDSVAETIKESLHSLIRRRGIDLIIPNNLQSVGYHIPAMKAIYSLIKETAIATIAHSHDFWWEDSGEVTPTCGGVREIYEKYAPPNLPRVQHVVINRISHENLLERKGIDATIVPNVFDFAQDEWERDEYNRDFRSRIGVGGNDILLLQATRVMDRKGIELAIDLACELDSPANRSRLETNTLYDGRRLGPDNRIVLACAGYVEQFGITGDYVGHLMNRASEKGVELKFVGDIVRHSRDSSGEKIFSLWDSYVHADLVTYPSWWEGWGNQFIEAVFARKPVYLFEYPVYITDLKPAGFDVVSLGSTLGPRDATGLVTIPPAALKRAASECVEMLINPQRRQRAVDHNFDVARERFSYEVLTDVVQNLIGSALG